LTSKTFSYLEEKWKLGKNEETKTEKDEKRYKFCLIQINNQELNIELKKVLDQKENKPMLKVPIIKRYTQTNKWNEKNISNFHF